MPRPPKPVAADPTLALAYVCSTEARAEHVWAVRAYADRAGLRLVDVFHDEQPGPLPEREGLIEMLVVAERDRIGRVVTYDHTALASTAPLFALAVRAIERSGASWVRVLERDLPWPGAAVDEAMEALLQHESMIYRPKVRLGMRGRGEARSRPGGPAPWGFRRDQETGQFVMDDAEQAVVAEIVARREAGASLDELAGYLQRLKMPGRSPKIYRSTIQSILRRTGRTP